MTKRTVFHVVYDSKRKLWVAKVRGAVVCVFRPRVSTIDWAQAHCLYLLGHGLRSQIIIHTKTGKIAKEHTYGNDPKRSKG